MMNQRLEKLRATVQDLERELNEIDSLDGATREVLAQAARDIQVALGDQEQASERLAAEPSMTERLRDAARDFETSHPELSGVLERVIDALGQLGI